MKLPTAETLVHWLLQGFVMTWGWWAASKFVLPMLAKIG